jgi:hypothetical protein
MQKVNLYQQEFHNVRNWSRTGAFAAMGLLALVLVGINIGQVVKLADLKRTLAQKTSALEIKQVTLEALRKNTRPIARDMDLAAQVDRLRNSNAEKTRAINYLNGNEISNVTGFSQLLQSLGRQRDSIDDIWLTRIKFSDGGYNMRLDGSSYKPELLPEFIQALNQEVLYKDIEFRNLRISRSQSNGRMVEFLLDTRARDAIDSKSPDALSLAMFMTRLKQFSASGQGI